MAVAPVLAEAGEPVPHREVRRVGPRQRGVGREQRAPGQGRRGDGVPERGDDRRQGRVLHRGVADHGPQGGVHAGEAGVEGDGGRGQRPTRTGSALATIAGSKL